MDTEKAGKLLSRVNLYICMEQVVEKFINYANAFALIFFGLLGNYVYLLIMIIRVRKFRFVYLRFNA